jgi:multiple sugar transport system ATP-binding protein
MGMEVRLSGLEKSFGKGVVAVRTLDLTIPSGEFVTLVGPSGCGKTTTLRMMAGLEQPTAGRILFGDQDVTDLQPADRNIAMVFQNYALYPHMTVQKNLGFGLKVRRTPRPEIERRVAETAKVLEIDPYLARRPRELSGGQRQRVALGRAMVRNPSLFLMDEPLSNLDARLRVTMRTELKRLHLELKTTTVYVTHDQLEAMTMSDRVAVMNHGVLQQYAPPHELYERPANTFVAGFIGSPPMNFFPASVEPTPSGLALRAAGGTVTLSPEVASALARGPRRNTVTVGARPEHLRLVPPGSSGALSAHVFVVEPVGAETFVTLTLDGTRLIARVDGDRDIAVDTAMGVGIDPRKLHLFDPETGAAIR